MDNPAPDQKIDITKDVCPMTFVRTRLKLETMAAGQVLEVTLRTGEPLKNVPRSVKEMGDDVIDLVEIADMPGTYRLTIRKG
ncbi:sulfurtransferase TusA family protein [Thalassospira lucentensis]|uniref:Sulfurtransferase TusA family protein n=1 Tax=Thalassospira lucentensis TaxID=168935 RepID=A0A358HY79_9PROT|nr:sulfurtransferase TusA family protein [Thalassospira lucentensis]RCK20308.1 preprotein translocase subunit TatB [Thalassospira lucentensis MCCC 1A00383 = DSM 14000]HBV00131.1 sulfurtransferase TusA family protein [Thalassospira lucentensis]HCW68650.1 sulfurtransferase TusA family protein [Thalassospira lucentensis]|tara:strand:- start:3202 stop:3447 length:246 start_codon:yes stop_codon:yes gene_type:complete